MVGPFSSRPPSADQASHSARASQAVFNMSGMAPRLAKKSSFITIARGVEPILSFYFDDFAPFRPVDTRKTHNGRPARRERP
jgi:hypothetical protein